MWELHKGKTGTPWGSGVRITNTSNVNSHIQYGPEGVVLSYRTVEENSVQKLVADLQRLSNVISFAMGMQRYLGVKPDEEIGTGKENLQNTFQSSSEKCVKSTGYYSTRHEFIVASFSLSRNHYVFIGGLLTKVRVKILIDKCNLLKP